VSTAGDEWEQARGYVERLRQKGRTGEQIRQIMLKGGWTQEQVEKLLAWEVLQAPAPPLLAPRPSPRPSAAPREFVRAQRAEGRSDTETRQKLKARWWSDEEIDRLLGVSRKKRGAVADLTDVFDHPWLQRWGRTLFAVSVVLAVLILWLLHEKASDAAAGVFVTACLFLFGFGMIALSRTLVSGELMSLVVRLLTFGLIFGVRVHPGPWVFRLLGSIWVGSGVAQIVYRCYLPHYPPKVAQSPAMIIGSIVGLAVWVGTWFVFRGYEEQ